MARHRRAQIVAGSIALGSVIFVMDLSLPLGVAGGVPYVAVVLLSLWSSDWRLAVMTALMCTVLTLVGYYYSPLPSDGVMWVAALNRLFALFAIWSVAILVIVRNRSEETLREKDEMFRSVVQASHDAVIVADQSGNIISWNQGAHSIFGYENLEILGRPLTILIPERYRSAYLGAWDHFKTTGIMRHSGQIIELEAVRKDGSEFPVEISLSSSRSEGLIFIGAFLRDITDRKFSETRLKLQAVALESAANAIGILDDKREIVWVNPAFANMTGYTIDEVIGQNISILDSDDTPPSVSQEVEKAIYSGKVWRGEVVNRRKDGTNSIQATTITPVMDAKGKITNFISIKEDITERKQAAEQLNLQAAALESAANAIVITDRKGVIGWVNSAFTNMTGYTAEEAMGLHTRVLKSGKQTQAFYQSLWSTVMLGQVWNGEIINAHKNGSLYTEEMTITPILNADGDITNFIAIKQDITERKQLEAQFLLAQKMESIGTLAGGVAHDFNNMLTGIMGFSELGATISSDERVKGYFQQIGKAGKHAAGLTRQLLAFSRREIVQPRVLDLNESIMETEKMLRRLIGEDIELVFLPAPDLGLVKADPGQIEQVLINMAVNSRDAMPDGGKLTIITCNKSAGVQLPLQRPETTVGEYTMFSVTDTGAGMSDEVKSRMFEPFFTTKEAGKGTGLGLSTCYGVVAQIGGFINVRSSPGQGTTFEVYLPRVEEPASVLSARTADEPLPRGVETILLVEDEPIVQEVAATLLQEQGYTVLRASGGAEAIEIMESAGKDVDLLLTDMVMPLMGGRQLAEQVWCQYPELKVLFTSGYTDDTVIRHGITGTDVEFLPKPFTQLSLAQKVREVLDNR